MQVMFKRCLAVSVGKDVIAVQWPPEGDAAADPPEACQPFAAMPCSRGQHGNMPP